MTKSHEACERAGYKFVPACVEVLGSWHPVAQDLIKRLGKALAITVGREAEETTRFLFQRLSIALAKGNCGLILSRVPSFAAQEVDGDIEGGEDHSV